MRILLFSVAICATCLPPAAQSAQPDVRQSLVKFQIVGSDSNGNLQRSTGSGFLISGDGFVLTAKHVFQIKPGVPFSPIKSITAVLPDGSTQELTELNIVDDRAGADVALIKLRDFGERGYLALALCKSYRPVLDEVLYGWGFPDGQEPGQRVGTFDSPNAIDSRWQTAILGSPSMSGGPVLNDQGNVVGMIQGGTSGPGARTKVTPIQWAISLVAAANPTIVDCGSVSPTPTQITWDMTQRLASDFADSLISPANFRKDSIEALLVNEVEVHLRSRVLPSAPRDGTVAASIVAAELKNLGAEGVAPCILPADAAGTVVDKQNTKKIAMVLVAARSAIYQVLVTVNENKLISVLSMQLARPSSLDSAIDEPSCKFLNERFPTRPTIAIDRLNDQPGGISGSTHDGRTTAYMQRQPPTGMWVQAGDGPWHVGWVVIAPSAGNYDLNVEYANAGKAGMEVRVGPQDMSTLIFMGLQEQTADATKPAWFLEGEVYLQPGENHIWFHSDSPPPSINALRLVLQSRGF